MKDTDGLEGGEYEVAGLWKKWYTVSLKGLWGDRPVLFEKIQEHIGITFQEMKEHIWEICTNLLFSLHVL